MDEFLWAFSIVGSRSLILNNTPMTPSLDPKQVIMILPLLDFINHSSEPNVVALPYHDRVNDNSYVVLQALREIQAGEQLYLSYGNLANTHFVQKYGFVQK
jgi:hypothetical protein